MGNQQPDLLTPILIKDSKDLEWPADVQVFYLLTGNGLFLCRQLQLFRSCVPVNTWPSELLDQQPLLEHSYPRVPKQVFEQLVGFFAVMAEKRGCEAAAYLVFDRVNETVSTLIPKQRATMRRSWSGRELPVGLEYDHPTGLSKDQMILGTVHSHVYESAYSSAVDVNDETEKPGVHIVIGRLDRDPPDLHAEAVVDGKRFRLDPREVIEGSAARNLVFPVEWLEQVEVVLLPSWSEGYGNSVSSYDAYGYGTGPYGGQEG